MPFHEHFDLTDFTVLEIYETWIVFVVKYIDINMEHL